MKKKTNWFVIIGLSLAVVCVLACFAGVGLIVSVPAIMQYALQNSSVPVGKPAPDFELPALSGETIRLSQFRGQPILLSLSATWCPPCREEVPLLLKLHKSHPELVVLMLDSEEDPFTLKGFAKEFGITYPILMDRPGTVRDQYHVYAIPTNLFIDTEGIIRAKAVQGLTPQLLAQKLPLIGITP